MDKIKSAAWDLYCRDTAGSMDVRDFWHELSGDVQLIYLKRATPETSHIEEHIVRLREDARHKDADIVERLSTEGKTMRDALELIIKTKERFDVRGMDQLKEIARRALTCFR